MEVIKYIQNNRFDGLTSTSAAAIRTHFFKTMKVTVSYMVKEEGKHIVYIFTGSKNLRGQQCNDVQNACNGLILEVTPEGWRILVLPLPAPKNSFNAPGVRKFIGAGLYDLYLLEDGTVMNLYYSAKIDQWVMATARGIEMNNVVYASLTYQQMFDECMSKYMDPADFYAGLDKSVCYTFGFKHPDMHPFREGLDFSIKKVWFVRAVDPSTGSIATKPFDKIPSQIKYDVKNIKNVSSTNANAYNEFCVRGAVLYGYMLISKTPEKTGDCSVVLLESSLLAAIRSLWYHSSYIRLSKSYQVSQMNIIITSSFLDPMRKPVFLKLFPQYSKEFARIEEKEGVVIDQVLNRLQTQDQDQEQPIDLTEAMANLDVNASESSNTDTNTSTDAKTNNMPDYDEMVLQSFIALVKSTCDPFKFSDPKEKVREIMRTMRCFELYIDFLP